ncbi:MAG: hypothetical protein PHD87_05850 [Candidatus Cloacimonetes bacterium]|nr:hypothetical protein [Candidatus Cloacimonadota bacterium]MDD4224090.1 hypothetical protein [Candidatus Cloacimonadota bacterium]
MLRPKVRVVTTTKFPRLRFWVALLFVALITAFVLYVVMPVLNIRFVGWILPLVICLIPLLGWPRVRKVVGFVIPLLLIWLVLVPFFSSGMFNPRKHRDLIGEVNKTEFSELVSPVNLNQVPIIDSAFAASLAEKKLGDDFALGSRVVLGSPTIQMVDSKLYWVAPLLHSGFFKWLTNRDNGTPGYIKVSATDPQDITFIRELNGKPIKIRYQRNSYFGQDLYRHLYYHGFMGKGLAGDTFELDDNGEPYWTITTYTHAIGVNAPEATGLATVHAGTGEIKYYPVKKLADGSFDDSLVPSWVDRIQPSYFVIPQLSWWGRYVHGFWNTLFGKRDMLNVTNGYNVIYGRDQRNYFYTGLSSVGSDEGTVGFSLTNTRTKKSHLYRLSGATEIAAMRSAEGKVQNFRYGATFPILVNLNGKPAYFMTLKDGSGLVKMFSFVSVSDFSLVGVGESVREARDNYQQAMAGSRVGRIGEKLEDEISLEGTVTRFGSDIKDGRTYYYFRLDSAPENVFIATSNLSTMLPLTGSGDRLRITYLKTTDQEISLTELVNLSLEGE